MLFALVVIGVILLVFWMATAAFLVGREVYLHYEDLETKKLHIAAEDSTARLLVEGEAKRRNSFLPPEPTDKPLFDRSV